MTGFVVGARPALRLDDTFAAETWAPGELAALVNEAACNVWLYSTDSVWPTREITVTTSDYLEYLDHGRIETLTPEADPRTFAYGYFNLHRGDELSRRIHQLASSLEIEWEPGHPARIYAGPAGSCSGLHWDGRMTSFVQLHGIKEAVVFAPSATRVLEPFPNPTGPNSAIDPFSDDAPALPPSFRFTLEPGSELDIPYGWWHSIRAVTTSVSVTFW